MLAGLLFVVAGGIASAATKLPLKRVLLSTGGVGYFEHEAVVDGNATLSLEVRLDQVDDVLKSIVVYDNTGRVGTVSLPGREPLQQAFRDMPFGRAALNDPATLMRALQGAHVLALGARKISGRIVSVQPETVTLPETRAVTRRHRVTLYTASGLENFLLEDARSVQFVNAALQAQVNKALGDVVRHRIRDRRTLNISLSGNTKRTVRVAYVVGAPLWKASYRLTVSSDEAARKAHLQGWAVVENMSGRDWEGVELTLISGNPVTFRQAIYTSYYVHRPEVPVEVLGRILPRPDTGNLDVGQLAELRDDKDGRRSKKKARYRVRGDAVGRVLAKGMVGGQFARKEERKADAMLASAPMESEQFRDVAAPVQTALAAIQTVSQESATQGLFRVPVPISIQTGHSLVVPIVDKRYPARRLALYQPATHQAHPLASVRLSNAGESGLPNGVLTLYERQSKSGAIAYLGDAQLRTLPAGEKRLVSFALDEKVRVERSAAHKSTIAKGSIKRGVFRHTVIDRQVTTYTLKGARREARSVVVEHPRMSGWKLEMPAKDKAKLAQKVYRFDVDLKAGEGKTLKVVVTRPRRQTVSLSNLKRNRIAAFAGADTLDPAVRTAFKRMSGMMAKIQVLKNQVSKLKNVQKGIFADQTRIRENMRRVAKNSKLYGRYMTKLDKQEGRLDTITGELEATHGKRRQAEAALADYIASLDI
jgi:hypothetical protein